MAIGVMLKRGQLMRIDRFADGLVAEILTLGEAQAMQPHMTGSAA